MLRGVAWSNSSRRRKDRDEVTERPAGATETGRSARGRTAHRPDGAHRPAPLASRAPAPLSPLSPLSDLQSGRGAHECGRTGGRPRTDRSLLVTCECLWLPRCLRFPGRRAAPGAGPRARCRRRRPRRRRLSWPRPWTRRREAARPRAGRPRAGRPRAGRPRCRLRPRGRPTPRPRRRPRPAPRPRRRPPAPRPPPPPPRPHLLWPPRPHRLLRPVPTETLSPTVPAKTSKKVAYLATSLVSAARCRRGPRCAPRRSPTRLPTNACVSAHACAQRKSCSEYADDNQRETSVPTLSSVHPLSRASWALHLATVALPPGPLRPATFCTPLLTHATHPKPVVPSTFTQSDAQTDGYQISYLPFQSWEVARERAMLGTQSNQVCRKQRLKNLKLDEDIVSSSFPKGGTRSSL